LQKIMRAFSIHLEIVQISRAASKKKCVISKKSNVIQE
jgi:hypothetical protein